VSWALDLAAVQEWGSAAYDHPTAPTTNGRRLAARLRWAF